MPHPIAVLFRARAEQLPDRPDMSRHLLAKADEIDAMVKRLRAMSNGLRHAAVCPAPSHGECPTFQRLLRAAGAGALEHKEAKARPRPRADGFSRRQA